MSGKPFSKSFLQMDQITCLVGFTFGVPYQELRSFCKDRKEKLLCVYVAHKCGIDIDEIAQYYHSYPDFLKNKIKDIAIKVMVDEDLCAILDVMKEDLNHAMKWGEKMRNGFEV